MNTVTATSRRALVNTLVGACLALGACAAAQAAEPAAPRAAVTVVYTDLNVATTAGANALYARISHAARQVCDSADIRDLAAQASEHACERAAISQAVHAVHSPQLAALVPTVTRG